MPSKSTVPLGGKYSKTPFTFTEVMEVVREWPRRVICPRDICTINSPKNYKGNEKKIYSESMTMHIVFCLSTVTHVKGDDKL